MDNTAIIVLCALLLLAYLFDISSARTKIPSVILLLFLGWLVRQAANLSGLDLPNFSGVLPILGTIGLILIVLEVSLELELNRSKTVVILKSTFGALFPMLIIAFFFGYLFHVYGKFSFLSSLTSAIPLAIISSAIAIPSVRNISAANKEFVAYESSMSDIIGVLLFNFIALNTVFGWDSFGFFNLQILLIIFISVAATIGLSFLLSKIDHHIKFIPIILLVILIYALSKIFHLPALIFILVFGLSIGNLNKMKRFKWMERFKLDELGQEVIKFKELTVEATFLIRALFFLLFGYLLESSEIINPSTLLWAVIIVIVIFALRAAQLSLSRLPLKPLLFIAPRGLITILLFISIAPARRIPIVNNSLIIQVILLTALVMMFGLMFNKEDKKDDASKEPEPAVPVTNPQTPETTKEETHNDN